MSRWQEIEELRRAALVLGPPERRALLDRADPELRQQVEALLQQDNPSQDATLTMIGAYCKIGPYEIEASIGKGGMGEVFRAVDTRLGRRVAIKTSHKPFDPRFEREARAISAVNHPHICTLYDVGPNYLVMELVEGETLAARLKRGSLSLQETLRYGAQIADALAEAHSKGITHRDLKPGNVMLGKNGTKVLDFGLAKFYALPDDGLTHANAVMGTPAYMAPEQREGKDCDARTDIYALGLILYEMSAGTRPHLDEGAAPPTNMPARLAAVVGKCLVRDRAGRYQTAGELRDELVTIQSAPLIPARRTKMIGAAAALLLLAGLAVGSYLYLRKPAVPSTAQTLVLANFTNTTGDPVFDGALSQGLSGQFAQSPFLTVLSDARVEQTLGLMGRNRSETLTPEIAREVCERSASSAVIEGSIGNLGTQYVLGLKAVACPSGDALGSEQGQAASKEQVLLTLSTLAAKLRVRLGESLASVEAYNTSVPEATTGSLDALRMYAAAMKTNVSGGQAAAIPLFKRAIELDPQFGSAYAALGLAYSGAAQPELSREVTIRAYELRERMIEPERLFVTFLYDREVTGNLEKALQTVQTWSQTYPRDWLAAGLLGGFASQGTARFDITLAATQKAIALNPDVTFPYASATATYLYMDRFAEAEKALQPAVSRGLDSPDFGHLRFVLAFLKNDQAAMDREWNASRSGKGGEDSITFEQGLVAAGRGQLRLATDRFQRAADLAKNAGQGERSAIFVAAIALYSALYQRPAEVNAALGVALQAPRKGNDLEFAAAFPLALIGELGRADTFANDLEKRFPEDTSVQTNYLPALRGLLALRRNKPEESLRVLQPALATELYIPRLSFNSLYGIMLPTYVRGLAYVTMQRPTEAAAEFQKIVDHRGIVADDPIGTFARLQLARAYASAGDRAKAKVSYQETLDLWKNADAGLALVDQTRAEAKSIE